MSLEEKNLLDEELIAGTPAPANEGTPEIPEPEDGGNEDGDPDSGNNGSNGNNGNGEGGRPLPIIPPGGPIVPPTNP